MMAKEARVFCFKLALVKEPTAAHLFCVCVWCERANEEQASNNWPLNRLLLLLLLVSEIALSLIKPSFSSSA